jgi:Domain of unknown function (DUF4404)
MDKQKLHRDLERLHTELQQVDSADGADREHLQRLAVDIRNLLEQEGSDTSRYRSLGAPLKEAIAKLEASHPRTTILMRQVIDQLAYMGI